MSGIQDIPLHERLEAPRVWVSNGSGLGVRLIDPDWIEKRLAKIKEDRKAASKKAHLVELRKTARECAEVASECEIDEQKIEQLQARLDASHKLIRVRLIIEIIATKRGIPYDVILGPGRTKAVVQARHEAMYEVKRQCPHLSLPEIGKRFGGRDHTSIMHAVKQWPKKAKALGIPCEPLESGQ